LGRLSLRMVVFQGFMVIEPGHIDKLVASTQLADANRSVRAAVLAP
jgi:hypothetical protein